MPIITIFIILMTVLFHDVHNIHRPNTEEGKIRGANFSEVTYADDTICVSRSEEEIEKGTQGNSYGRS